MDTNKMHGEKARWELHKNATGHFEQILGATPNKTAVAWPPTFCLTNHPSNKICRVLGGGSEDKLISDVSLWTPTHGHTSVGQPAKTYIHQLSADTGCSLEDIPGAVDD